MPRRPRHLPLHSPKLLPFQPKLRGDFLRVSLSLAFIFPKRFDTSSRIFRQAFSSFNKSTMCEPTRPVEPITATVFCNISCILPAGNLPVVVIVIQEL